MARSNVKNKTAIEIDVDFDTGENFDQLLQNSFVTQVIEDTITKGEVIAIEKDLVVVDIGAKNEGYIPLKEFEANSEYPKPGDVFDVYVERIESRNGNTILSRDKALKEEYWVVLENALKHNNDIEGVIFGKVKGGFTVDVNGIIAFLPGSQVDVRPIKDMSPLMGINQPFKILKIDRKQGNVVVSRRAILEATIDVVREEVLSNIKEGQVMEGVVKNITDYGAFIDLGNVDGLLHVTDISWGRINHPSEILTLGQTIKVQVIKYNNESKRISLGMKQLEDNPWKDIEKRFPQGKTFKGIVTNITDYGIFVELEPGIEGLVHVSEIAWGKSNVHPKKLINPKQEVDFVILDIDASKHRISLGMKQCKENPWAHFADSHPVSSAIEGYVKNIVDFGVFVGFEDDIDGLVHVSDLSWNEEEASSILKDLKKDQKLKVKILSIDVDKERISLGVKQLSEDNSSSADKDLKKGNVITCTISAIKDDGIEVMIEGKNIIGFIKTSDLSSEKSEQKLDRFAVGERVDAKILSHEKSGNKIALSIKQLEIDDKKKAIKEYGSTDSGASLGDILGEALSGSEYAKKKN